MPQPSPAQPSPAQPSPAQRAARAVVAVVLLVAAAAKLYGLESAPYAQHGWLALPAVQLVAVEWELVLGLWLLSGVWWAGAWLAASVTFLAFAVISGAAGLAGQTSCGCFGAIRTNPWAVFAVDLAILLTLLTIRPPIRQPHRLALPAGLVAAGLALWAAVATDRLVPGVGDRLRSALHSEAVAVRPTVVDLGTHSAQDLAEATVEVVNRSDRPVRLIGGTDDCTCSVMRDLPLTIQPRERASVRVRVRPATGAGRYTRQAHVWTDHPDARTVWFSLTGRAEPVEYVMSK